MSFEIYIKDGGITVYKGMTEMARYIKKSNCLNNVRGTFKDGLENLPFVDGDLKNPYSKYSQNFEAVEEVIRLYNASVESFPEKETTFSMY